MNKDNDDEESKIIAHYMRLILLSNKALFMSLAKVHEEAVARELGISKAKASRTFADFVNDAMKPIE